MNAVNGARLPASLTPLWYIGIENILCCLCSIHFRLWVTLKFSVNRRTNMAVLSYFYTPLYAVPVFRNDPHPWKPANLWFYAVPQYLKTIPKSVPEIIYPVFAKTSPKRSFSMTEYERFGLGFTKTRVYKFGHWSRPKQADTNVSRYRLDWKRAFWACFRENDHFHVQNSVYKFGHSCCLPFVSVFLHMCPNNCFHLFVKILYITTL